jgi:hypothetical protein
LVIKLIVLLQTVASTLVEPVETPLGVWLLPLSISTPKGVSTGSAKAEATVLYQKKHRMFYLGAKNASSDKGIAKNGQNYCFYENI